MNKQKTTNRQTVAWKLFTVKSNSRNDDWIVDPFPQVKSAEHMAQINTKNIYLKSGAFPNFFFLKTLSKIYKTSMKHL